MTNHVMQPLAQKVTQQEIDDFAHDPENHYGSSPDFKGVYNFLQEMGAFTKAAIVAFDIYGDGPLNEETEAMKRAGKSPQTAGHRRLDGLRYGRRSFTPREAQYFHDAFRRVCGDEWADTVSPKDFVTQPIGLTMTELVCIRFACPVGNAQPCPCPADALTSFQQWRSPVHPPSALLG